MRGSLEKAGSEGFMREEALTSLRTEVHVFSDRPTTLKTCFTMTTFFHWEWTSYDALLLVHYPFAQVQLLLSEPR